MLVYPNAKINLGLFVTSKKEDGYHNIETIFYPLKTMRDALEIVPASAVDGTLYISGLPVEGDALNNLVWRAYLMLKEHFPRQIPPLDIYLHKAIPMGSGLGGGSADGAFALQMLNDYCALGLDGPELERFALTLGSDCPFFIRNTPQYATNRGEKMEPIDIDLSAYRIEIICPDVHVSTREAFSNMIPRPAPFDLRTLSSLPVSEWRAVLTNDFEETVFALHPQLATIKERMYKDGALYASLSGSGSAVYGLFGK